MSDTIDDSNTFDNNNHYRRSDSTQPYPKSKASIFETLLIDNGLKEHLVETNEGKKFKNPYWNNEKFEKYKFPLSLQFLYNTLDCWDKAQPLYDENDKGYNEWFRSEEGLNVLKASNITQMNKIIEQKKKQARDLIVHNDYIPLGGNSSYDLTREALENYSSDIFSKLQFEDLKKAHSETVIPVSEEDMLNRPQYENMMDLKISREKDNMKPMNNNEVQLFLKRQEEKNMQIGSNTAFRLAKQSQEASRINNNISRHFNRILN